jgi:chemotaxis protein MotA
MNENKSDSMKVSFTAIVGVLLGLGLFILAVWLNTDNYLVFFSFSGFAMVVGGTLAVAMISHEGRYVLMAFKDILHTLTSAKVDPRKLYEDVGVLIDWAIIVRKEGLIRLENKVEVDETDTSFLKRSFLYLLSGYQGHKLRILLKTLSNQSMTEICFRLKC